MRPRRWTEILLYLGSLAGVAFASYTLFFQNSKVERVEAPSAESLGIVRPIGEDVRLKPQGQLNWQTLGSNENTYEQDTIFTGQNSRAKLDFTSGTEILVDPKSLLIVSREGKREKILTLDYGGFSGKILKGERLMLQTKEKKIEISGLQDSSIRIEKTEDQKLVVSALEGNLQVQSDLKIEEVQANENLKLDVKTNEIVREKLQISLLNPKPSKILWLTKESPVRFEWQGADTQKSKVVIATDPSFTNIVKEVSSAAASAEVLLASNQSYYWRVESGEDTSPVSEFTVAPLEKPQVISPVQKSQISAQNDKASVELKWKDQTLSETYEVQIGRDPALSQVEKRVVTNLGSTQVALAPGNYFARIRGQHPERVVALESDVVEFTVVAQKTEAPPVLTEIKEPKTVEEKPPVALEKPIEIPSAAQPLSIKKVKREPAQEKKPIPEVTTAPLEPAIPAVMEPPKAEENPLPQAKPETPIFSITWPKFWMYFGIGANYTRIEEKSSEVKSNYPGLSAPSFAFEGGTALTDMTNVAVQYKTTPANGDNKAEKSSNLSYVWKTAGVEASTRLNKATEGSQWSLLYGVQYHAVPIVIFEPLTLLPSVREAQYLNAVMGAKYQYFVSQRQFFVISGHYQHPLSSSSAGSSGFQMKSPFIFDGSVGSEYRMTEALWGGIYWYGQYHSFKYDYADQGALRQNTQSMIYSNIELRLSFRF